MGHWYNVIVENKLAEKNGYKHARDYLNRQFRDRAPSQATLTRLAAVAHVFAEADAVKYHATNLSELIHYLKAATQGPVTQVDPGAVKVRVPQKDGTTVEKLFPECSKDEIIRATHALEQQTSSTIPAEDLKLLEKCQAAVAEEIGDHIALKPHEHKGVTLVTLSNVPLNRLLDLAKALARVDESGDGEGAGGSTGG